MRTGSAEALPVSVLFQNAPFQLIGPAKYIANIYHDFLSQKSSLPFWKKPKTNVYVWADWVKTDGDDNEDEEDNFWNIHFLLSYS